MIELQSYRMFWGLIINIYDGLIPTCTIMLNIKTISIQSNQFEKKYVLLAGLYSY